MKSGWKSTEFWLSTAALIAGLVMSSGVLVDGSTAFKVVGLIISGLAALGYTSGRSQIKKITEKENILADALKEHGKK